MTDSLHELIRELHRSLDKATQLLATARQQLQTIEIKMRSR